MCSAVEAINHQEIKGTQVITISLHSLKLFSTHSYTAVGAWQLALLRTAIKRTEIPSSILRELARDTQSVSSIHMDIVAVSLPM